MVFPQTPLSIKVEAMLGGSLTDITSYVYKDSITIERGAADEASNSKPATCSFMLNNGDGRFSPRKPDGPYYGTFGRNTELLVSIAGGDNYLDIPGSGHAQVADTAQIDVTGDIDASFDATLKDWAGFGQTADTIDPFGKFTSVGDQRSWWIGMRDGRAHFEWSTDGTGATVTEVDSTVDLCPDPSGRMAVRVTLDVDNGASGNTTTFYTAPTMEGPWVQLGEPVVNTGTTSIFNSTSPLRVGNGTDVSLTIPYGKFHEAKVLNGINGTVAAHAIFADEALGTGSFTGADGLTWTMSGVAAVNNQINRFRGEVVGWPSRWETGGFDVWVPLTAQSLLRRHNQGNRALKSALTRRIPSDPDVLAYWPMEDQEDSTQFGSAITGVPAMTYVGDVTLAGHPGPGGSDDLPSWQEGSTWSAVVPGPATATDEYQVEWIVNLQQLSATNRTMQRIQTTGSVLAWNFFINNTAVGLTGTSRDGTLLVNTSISFTTTDYLNIWVRWRFRVRVDGANSDWDLTLIPILGTGQSASGTYAGSTGRVTGVSGPPDLHADLDGLAWGHMAVFSSDAVTAFDDADHGFTGETAYGRMVRLVEEAGEQMVFTGAPNDSAPMGAQRPDKLMDLLVETAAADRGIFTDSRDWEDFTAFKLIGIESLYNQQPRLILGYTANGELHAPLDPTDDDLYTRNAITATRERGSSVYLEKATGPLSIADVGYYEDEIEVNVESDEQLPSIAGWEIHLRTWDEERYPTVLVKLQAATHLIADAALVDVGCRIRFTDPPAWLPPDTVELLVRGYRETFSQFEWEIEFQCVPARPYDVPVLDRLSSQVNRLDTEGTELSEALDTTETAIEVFTTSGPTWTDDVQDTPFDWTVGGEAMTVIAPGSLVNDNPFFATDATGWTASGSTIARSTAVVHPNPLAVASLFITPDGVTASPGAGVTRTAVGTINPGARYACSMWVYSTLAHTDFHLSVNWHDSADTFLSTSNGAAVSVAAGEWTYIEQELTAPASASRAGLFVRQGGTPAASKTWYAWAARISRPKASLVYDEFGRTDTDTWTNADSSQAWTNTGGAAADYDVLSGYGRHINPAVSVSHYSRTAVTEADYDAYVDITTAATPTGGALYASLQVRHADTSNWYEARLTFSTANVITLTLRENVAGATADLDTFTHWLTHAAGTFMRVRLQVIGTALKAKAWRVGHPEPDVWQVEATDASLSAAGSIAVRSVRDAANTNANAELRFDNLELANPQVYTVTRSANTVVKSHSSGAAVSLRHPMIFAL